MMLFNVLLTVSFLTIQLWHSYGEDIQYSFKVVSDTIRDNFAYSLATAPQRLLIGAPDGNYILTEAGVKVRAPQGKLFGLRLDVNEQFMVVSGDQPHSVYIYPSSHPYTLVVRIPVGDFVLDVKILDDNSIIIADLYGYVSIYKYTHHSSWDRQQRIVLEDYVPSPSSYISLAVSGRVLVVGYGDGYRQSGRVNVYKKVNDQYTKTATLHPPGDVQFNDVDYFGWSVATEGQHLVVSSRKDLHNDLLTYEFDPSGGKWLMSGRFTVHNPYAFSHVSLQNDILAVTVTDPHNNPEVCAYGYKLSNNSNNNHPDNTSNSVSKTEFKWIKVATLKTNGMPTTHGQFHNAIRVQDGHIFTGRLDYYGDGYGMVFVHEIYKH